MNTITKNQASKYDIQFNYSGAAITYADFLKILPPFGVKTAPIERNKKNLYTLIKKLMLTSFTNRFWSSVSTSERKDSLLQVSYSCENKEDIFQSSKNFYYYLEKKKQFAGFVKAPQTSLRYALQSDL